MNINNYGVTKHINVIVTNKCNRNCKFCVASKNVNKENVNYITIDNIKKAILFAKENNIKTVALTGGEPTLHPEIIEIVELFKENDLEVSIYTNNDYKDKVKSLDGLVDHIFVSYYGNNIPKPNDFYKSQIIITVLLLKEYFKNINDLDKFIEKHRKEFQILFTVPVNVNEYCEKQTCDFLDKISKQNYLPMTLPDGTFLQIYNGCIIKRTDLHKAFVNIETFSYKMHVDGEISHFYGVTAEEISKIEDKKLRTELLSTHNNKERQRILSLYRK